MVPSSLPRNNLDPSNFGKRICSAAVSIPVVVGAIMLGSPYVDLLAVALLGVLLWEWSRMSTLPLSHPINGVVVVLLGWAMVGTGTFWPAFCLALAGFSFIVFYHYQLGAKLLPSLVLLSGPLYMGMGTIACLNLAKQAPLTLLWALLVVWATDTGAYVVGSLVGGPRLVPHISPGKTWAGFVGGSMLGSSLGVMMAPYCQLRLKDQILLGGLAMLTTLVGHAGDILESAAKRLFKVKDSSHIIPGHGGLFDRIDSLLLVAFFVVVLKFLTVF